MIKLDVKECNFKWHWSSAEHSTYNAWVQYFGNGIQGGVIKSNGCWVRAIRKVKK